MKFSFDNRRGKDLFVSLAVAASSALPTTLRSRACGLRVNHVVLSRKPAASNLTDRERPQLPVELRHSRTGHNPAFTRKPRAEPSLTVHGQVRRASSGSGNYTPAQHPEASEHWSRRRKPSQTRSSPSKRYFRSTRLALLSRKVH